MASHQYVSFPRLDPLRALCFLAVFGCHAFYTTDPAVIRSMAWRFPAITVFGPGALGVNVFFVLSGFLITHLLIAEKALNRRVDVPRFWLRRILRIWPLYFLVVLIGYALIPAVKAAMGSPEPETADIRSYLFFFSNLTKAQSIEPASSALTVLWSIAVEEQFYLVWPLLLVAVPKRWLAIPCASIVLGSVAFRYQHPEEPMRLWHSFSCMGDLAMGALGAVALNTARGRTIIEGWGNGIALLLHGGLLGLYAFTGPMSTWTGFGVWYPALFSATATGVVLYQAVGRPGPLQLPSGGPLAAMGRISYGLYCLHQVALLVILQVMARVGFGHEAWHVALVQPVLVLALSVLLAMISHRHLEKPFLRLKDRFAYVHRG